MRYRSFGRLDYRPSALGFGTMRLPFEGGDHSKVVEDEAIKMIRWAIDQGVNYVDTAYPYHEGKSEEVVGRALRDGYREKVKLATKSPVWLLLEKPDDFERYLDEQLGRLQVDYMDFYLLHALRESWWAGLKSSGVLARAEEALAKGKIRHLGFSFHDRFEVFKDIIDAYPHWESCQIQYNYMDIENQAGTRGLEYAADHDLAVVIMEPLRGGALAVPPAAIQSLWDEAPVKRSPVDWALQWLWSRPEVSLVLSGMSTMDQVKENVASACRSGEGLLTEDELTLVDRVRERYGGLGWVPCTQCGYCQPCPHGVAIPNNFEAYNFAFSDLDRGRNWYARATEAKLSASFCEDCGQCDEKCPQHLPVAETLKRVHALLEV